jgi:hypothetical protein
METPETDPAKRSTKPHWGNQAGAGGMVDHFLLISTKKITER